MHYFTRGTNIAAVEDADQAEKYRAAGWSAISHEDFMQRWRIRDLVRLHSLRVEAYWTRRQAEAQAEAERALVKFHGI